MTAGEGACASAAWRSTAGVLAWPIKFPALRTGSSRAPKGANTRPPPGAEKGSGFAEERRSGRSLHRRRAATISTSGQEIRDRCQWQGEGADLRRRVGAEGCPHGRRAATISTSGQVAPLRMTGGRTGRHTFPVILSPQGEESRAEEGRFGEAWRSTDGILRFAQDDTLFLSF